MYDCVIVGGGVVGLSIADQLSLRGRRVAVVDHQTTRRQTSWAAAGILPPANEESAHDDFGRLCGLSWRLHAELADRFAAAGHNVGYRRCGGLHLARTPGEAASLSAVAQQWSDDGISVEQLAVDELLRRFPVLSDAVAKSEIRRAFWAPNEAQVRTPRYLKALRSVCEQQGVEFIENRRVTNIMTHDGTVTGVKTTGDKAGGEIVGCLLYTSPSPRDATLSRMPSSA